MAEALSEIHLVQKDYQSSRWVDSNTRDDCNSKKDSEGFLTGLLAPVAALFPACTGK